MITGESRAVRVSAVVLAAFAGALFLGAGVGNAAPAAPTQAQVAQADDDLGIDCCRRGDY